MTLNRTFMLSLTGFCSLFVSAALAKDAKPIVPAYVLRARTVAVIIDPEAGMNLHDPNANQTAQRDVETALQAWGRFKVVLSPQSADLIIVVRKGLGKLAAETTKDPRQDSRPGSVIQTPGAISIGAQHGQPTPNSSHQPGSYPGGPVSTQPQMEIGRVNDSFAVYEGDTTGNPTDSSAAWRWDRKNGLHAHDVPAVDEFRKALTEAEKQAAAQQSKHP